MINLNDILETITMIQEENLDISGKEALKTHKLIMSLYENGGMRKN